MHLSNPSAVLWEARGSGYGTEAERGQGRAVDATAYLIIVDIATAREGERGKRRG